MKRLQTVKSEVGGVRAKFPASSPNCYLGFRNTPLRQYEASLLDRSRITHEQKEMEQRNKKLVRHAYDRGFEARLRTAQNRAAWLVEEAAKLDLEIRRSPCEGCDRLEEHRKEAARMSTLD